MAKKLICNICKKEINTSKDKYTRITDYKESKVSRENFYHSKCFIDKIKPGAESVTQSNSLLKQAQGLMSQLTGSGRI